jgi:hypothetical protein
MNFTLGTLYKSEFFFSMVPRRSCSNTKRAACGVAHSVAAARWETCQQRGGADGRAHLRARALGVEVRGAICHDMASHDDGHGRPVHAGGAGATENQEDG